MTIDFLTQLLVVMQELEGVSETNRQALWQVDSALMVLCLDDEDITEPEDATHTLLHNYGRNRSVYLTNCYRIFIITVLTCN